MRTVLIPFIALALILGVLYAVFIQLKPEQEVLGPGGKPVLIVYDEPTNAESHNREVVSAESLAQLLCHFSVSLDKVSTAEYKKGMAKDASFVFYVGTKLGQPLPSYMIDDIFDTRAQVMWIGANLERMQNRHSMDKWGISLVDDSDNHLTNDVEYKGRRLAKIDLRTFAINVTRPALAKVMATARFAADPLKPAEYGQNMPPGTPESPLDNPLETMLPEMPIGQAVKPIRAYDLFDSSNLAEFLAPPPPEPPAIELPYIVHSDNFWYVASDALAYSIEGGAYLALADVLHDFLGQNHKERHRAFVRLEDIHAKRQPGPLKLAADLLYERGVPFAFTLTPVYKNPATDETIYLSDDPEFQETIKYLISRGGSVILHGYTHQISGETAVDYEFWSHEIDGPVSAEDATFASVRIERALNECFLNGIYPLAWTTPHYAAGQVDYSVFANYFTTVVERRMPVELFGSDQFFPYLIKSDKHKQIIIPESLGYVNPKVGRSPEAILADAEATKVVRDGWASFFFHTYLDLKLLEEVVDGLIAQEWEFTSLTDFNNKVTTRDRVVVSGIGEVILTLGSQYKHELTIGRQGEILGETYSFGTVTGDIHKYVSMRPGELQVLQGSYQRPKIGLSNITLFRPTVSGVTNPVALAILILGILTLITFLILWVFLITRKTFSGARKWMASRKEEES
jgi:uncharacterized protein YdaL